MTTNFDVDKIVSYLSKYKSDLPTLYNWNAKIGKLAQLQTLTEPQISHLNSLTPYEKELELKQVVGQKLNSTFHSDPELFKKLCLWVIKDWGGIAAANDDDTIKLVEDFLGQPKPGFKRIASLSKVGSYMFPESKIIYDSRVAYSLNWIILAENAGNLYFPIPVGRNSKMTAFDLNVLIRLRHLAHYSTPYISDLDHPRFITKADDKIYIKKEEAYFEMNKLVKMISEKLWKGDSEKESKLYFTEMLLFSIADREVIKDITLRYATL